MPSPESLRRRMWCVAISFVAVVTGGHAFAQPASPPESAGTTPAGSAYRPAGRASIYSTLSRTSSDDGTSKGESALNTSLFLRPSGADNSRRYDYGIDLRYATFSDGRSTRTSIYEAFAEARNADGTVATIGDLNSRYAAELAVNDAVLAEAEASVPFRNFQSAHFYVLQTDLEKVPDVFNSDGIPPNGSRPVASGTAFPDVHEQGDYFLRLDFLPPVLYRRDETKWTRVETNWRSPWLPAGRVLASFINNTNTITLQDGNTIDQRANLRTAMTSKLDPDIV